MALAIGSMVRAKRAGERGQPCRTPLISWIVVESWLLMLMLAGVSL